MTNKTTEFELRTYLKEKNVEGILSSITEAICLERPKDVETFIVNFLQKKKDAFKGDVSKKIDLSSIPKARNKTKGALRSPKPGELGNDENFNFRSDSEGEEDTIEDMFYSSSPINNPDVKEKKPAVKEKTKKERKTKKRGMNEKDSASDEEMNEEYQEALENFAMMNTPSGPKSKEMEMVEKEGIEIKTAEIDTSTSENIRRKYSVSTIRRKAFSSESINMKELKNFKPPVIPKTDEELKRLEKALSQNPLFSHFEREDLDILYKAMFAANYKKGDFIMRQGDKGEHFYVVESGTCEIYVKMDKNREEMVKICRTGDSFGELALMYGTPRAASIKSATDVKLWAIDRNSYRKIIMNNTMGKRDLYEGFLKKVPLLGDMNAYERLTVADALQPQNFQKGDLIIKQGDLGQTFFVILDGICQVHKEIDGKRVDLIQLKAGDYFGELALLFDQPRAATVEALTPIKTVSLDQKSFKLLLGSVDEILKRNTDNYEFYMKKKEE